MGPLLGCGLTQRLHSHFHTTLSLQRIGFDLFAKSRCPCHLFRHVADGLLCSFWGILFHFYNICALIGLWHAYRMAKSCAFSPLPITEAGGKMPSHGHFENVRGTRRVCIVRMCLVLQQTWPMKNSKKRKVHFPSLHLCFSVLGEPSAHNWTYKCLG